MEEFTPALKQQRKEESSAQNQPSSSYELFVSASNSDVFNIFKGVSALGQWHPPSFHTLGCQNYGPFTDYFIDISECFFSEGGNTCE